MVDHPVTDQDLDKLEYAAREALTEVAARWRIVAARTAFRTACGDAAEGILRLAETERVELIVMASHGRGALGRLRFGSVAGRVARAAEIPVVVVRPDPDAEHPAELALTRLVVPYDGSELAAQAFPVAATLARRLGRPVRVVRAIDPGRTWRPAVALGTAISTDAVTETETALKTAAQQSVDEAAERLRAEGIDAYGNVVVGPAAGALLDAVGPHDLVVLTSHGRSGLRRWWLGSIAEKLVRFADAPVVMVPTAGRAGRHAPATVDVNLPAIVVATGG